MLASSNGSIEPNSTSSFLKNESCVLLGEFIQDIYSLVLGEAFQKELGVTSFEQLFFNKYEIRTCKISSG